jgi:hypothetical protein
MPGVPWWERDEAWSPTIEDIRRKTEPLRELAARMDTPELRALRTTIEDWRLTQSPEGRAVLAERAQERHRVAVGSAVAHTFEQLAAAAAEREIATLDKFVEPRRAGWRPRLSGAEGSAAGDPVLLLEEREDQEHLLAVLRQLSPATASSST